VVPVAMKASARRTHRMVDVVLVLAAARDVDFWMGTHSAHLPYV
jgi:hypothetical protein